MKNRSDGKKFGGSVEPEGHTGGVRDSAVKAVNDSTEVAGTAPDSQDRMSAESVGRVANDDDEGTGWMSAEAAVRAAQAASQVVWQAAEQSRNLTAKVFDSMSALVAPLAGMGFARDSGMTGANASVADAYERAARNAGANVQALFASYSRVGDGFQRMQRAYLEVLTTSMSPTRRQPLDLLRCKSPVEFAEVQKEIYVDGVALMLESSRMLFQVANEVMQSTVPPPVAQATAPSHA